MKKLEPIPITEDEKYLLELEKKDQEEIIIKIFQSNICKSGCSNCNNLSPDCYCDYKNWKLSEKIIISIWNKIKELINERK